MNGVAFWGAATLALLLLAALILGDEPLGVQAAILWLSAFATSVGAAVLRRRGRWLGIALRVSDSGMMEIQGDKHVRRVGWGELAYLRVRPLLRTVEVGLRVPGAPIHIPFETGSIYRLVAIILTRAAFGVPENAA